MTDQKNSGSIKRTEKSLSFLKYYSTIAFDAPTDGSDNRLYSLFVTLCDASFLQPGLYAKRVDNRINWYSKKPLNMHLCLETGEEKTLLHVDASMYGKWYGLALAFFYAVLSQFTGLIYFLVTGTTQSPFDYLWQKVLLSIGGFLLFSGIITVAHNYFKRRRAICFDKAVTALADSLQHYLNREPDERTELLKPEAIDAVIPDIDHPCSYEAHKTLTVQWKMPSFTKEEERFEINGTMEDAGVKNAMVNNLLDVETLEPVGFHQTGGEAITFIALPDRKGTKIHILSHLNGFVERWSFFSFIAITALAGSALPGRGTLLTFIMTAAIYGSIAFWSIVKFIRMFLRRKQIDAIVKELKDQ